MNKRILSMLLVIVMVLSMLPVQAMAEGGNSGGDEGVASQLVIHQKKSRTSVKVTGEVLFNALLDGKIPADNVTWDSEPAELVKIESTGTNSCRVIGLAEGKVKIKAKVGEVEAQAYDLTVFTSATSAKITAESATLKKDETLNLSYTYKPDSIIEKVVSWESSDPSVAAVDGNGALTGKKAGTVSISLKFNGKTVTKEFTVTDPDAIPEGGGTVEQPKQPTVQAEKQQPKKNEEVRLTAVLPEGTSVDEISDINWQADNEGASVTVNTVNPLECTVESAVTGDVTITFSYKLNEETKQGSCTLTVSEDEQNPGDPVIEGSLDILLGEDYVESLLLDVGEEVTFTASVPEGVDASKIQWTVPDNNENIKIQPNGASCVVTGLKGSETPVTLTAAVEDTELTGSVTIYVNAVDATSISIVEVPAITVGATHQMECILKPEGSTGTVVWSSKNPKIVSVDSQTGEITALKKGTATITATCNDQIAPATVKVTVLPQTILELGDMPDTLLSGDSIALKATVKQIVNVNKAAVDTDDEVLWVFADKSDSDFAILEDGVLTAKAALENAHIIYVKAIFGETESEDFAISLIPRVKELLLKCGEDNVTNESVQLNLANETAVANGIRISPAALPEDAGCDVEWHISDSRNITTHRQDGQDLVVYPSNSMKTGSITVTAVAKDGSNKTAKTTVRLVRLATDVEIYGAEDLRTGASITLSTNVERDKTLTDRTIQWSVDNDKVATISSSGKLTARKVGTVIVTATANAGTMHETSSEVEIHVYPAIESITVSFPEDMGIRGNSATVKLSRGSIALDATIMPDSTKYVWTTSDKKIATVKDGVVTLLKAGRVRIGCESDDGTRIKSYVYLDIVSPVTSVEIDASDLNETLTSGSYTYLKATAWADGGAKAANQKILWSVTDVYGNRTSAATINSSGRLTAKNVNVSTTVLVTARSAENNSIYDCIELTIKPKRNVEFNLFIDDERLDGTVNLNPYQEYTVEGKWVYSDDDSKEDANHCSFYSSNANVASVTQDGTVKTKGSGTAVITVRCTEPESGRVFTTKLTVKVFNVAGYLTINASGVSAMRVGQYLDLKATVWTNQTDNIKATNQSVRWSVYKLEGSNMVATDHAVISSSGRLTIKNVGTTETIRVIAESVENEGVVDSVDIAIYPKDSYKLYFQWQGDKYTDTLYVDRADTLNNLAPMAYQTTIKDGKIKYANDVKPDKVVWSTGNNKVVGVTKDGKLAIVGTGSAKLTAKCTFGKSVYSASITVKVVSQVKSITVKEKISGQKLYAGKTLVMRAVVDSAATNKSVLWSLDDDSKQYATISAATGLIRAKREISEQVTITVIATAQDGSYTEGTKTITIYPLATGVTIGDKNESVSMNWKTEKTKTLTATVSPNGANDDVKWSSSNIFVATVDQNGKVTAKRKGTVTITAEALDGSGKSASVKLTIK